MPEHALTSTQIRAVELYSILAEVGFDRFLITSVVGSKLLQEGAELRGVARTVRVDNKVQFYEEALEIEGLLINDLGVHQGWEGIKQALAARESGQVEWGDMETAFFPGDTNWFGGQRKRNFEIGQDLLLSGLARRQIVANMQPDDNSKTRPRQRL